MRIRVVVDPKLPDDPNSTWLQATLQGHSLGDLINGTILWGPEDD